MQSTENEDRATPADVTRAELDALVTELREFGQAVTVGWLSADRYARAAAALAAERDRADRAEARLREARKAMKANQTVDGVTDRGWLTPDEWLLDKVAEALGEDEATA